MPELPPAFLGRMRAVLGEAGYGEYLAAMALPPARSGRINTLKITPERFAALTGYAVQWEAFSADTAFSPGTDIFHAQGLYYMQESSARFPASLFHLKDGMCVLDLCAAPGGKSGQLAARLHNTGLLLSNELVPQRAKILEGNLERLGVTNAAVTCMEAEALTALTGPVFDAVLVDAPCAGEGMFRKDPDAVRDWSEEHVQSCAVRQRKLLLSAANAVKPGGELVYSTCSFSPAENGETVQYFLEKRPDFSLVTQRTLYPHTSDGEGQFAALLVRGGQGEETALVTRKSRPCREWEAFQDELHPLFAGTPTALPDGRVFLLPPLPAAWNGDFPKGLRLLRGGLLLGEAAKGRFTPAHALAMAGNIPLLRRTVPLNEAEACRYLAGETLATDIKGWCAVTCHGFALGLGKGADGILKNHLPKGLRILKNCR